MSIHAVAKIPTPVLNVPNFKKIFCPTPPRGRWNLVYAVETVAPPGTPFRVVEKIEDLGAKIFRVEIDWYPADNPLYIDSRFVECLSHPPSPSPSPSLPAKNELVKKLRDFEGTPYIWGGNWSLGIPDLLEYYPPPKDPTTPPIDEDQWILRGVDCSGLLYETTKGVTPRNTSQLVTYGESLPIQGKTAQEIISLLEPLDLIVWVGHVLIALDNSEIIESSGHPKLKKVVITPALVRMEEILNGGETTTKKRYPVNAYGDKATSEAFADRFVINRWYPNPSP
jgi:hypothetical protein